MDNKQKLRLVKGEIEELENSCQDIFEHALECISRVDNDGNYLSVNHNYARVCGYTPSEMRGMDWQQTVHPNDISIARECFKNMLDGGHAEAEFRGIRKGGETFYKQIILVKAIDGGNSKLSHYCFMRDITEESLNDKQLLESIKADYQRYISLLNNVPGIVYRVSAKNNWQFDFISNAVNDMSGINATQFQNSALRLLYKYTHKDDLQKIKQIYLVNKKKPRHQFAEEYRMITDSDAVIWVKNSGTCFYDSEGELEYIDGVIIDISSAKYTQLNYQALNQRLLKNEQSIKSLYQITSDQSFGFAEKVDRILEICADYLNVDIGIYGELTTDAYKLIRVHDASDLGLNSGLELTREGSYCNQTGILNKTVALEHVAKSDYAALPGYQKLKLETYLGVPISVNGQIFGTVCFIHKTPRDNSFSKSEIEFIQLAAQWIATEQQKIVSEQALNVSEDRQNTLIDIQPECVKQITAEGNLLYINPAGLGFIEADSLQQVKGLCVYDLVTEEHRQAFIELNERVFNGETVEQEFEIIGLKGTRRWMQTTAKPIYSDDGKIIEHFAVTRDISAKKENAMLVEMERNAYEIITHEISLHEIIESLIHLVESYSQDMICSVMFFDDSSRTLKNGCAPSLPTEYCDAINNAPVAEGIGSCGTAAYRDCCVIVEDIENDPLWADFKHLALPHGLKACWSNPIHSTKRQLLGTFACYYKEARSPAQFEKNLIYKLTPIISYAIERNLAQETLSESEERFSLAMQGASDGLWDWNVSTNVVYYSPRWKSMLGYDEHEIEGTLDNFKQLLHPDDIAKTFRHVEDYQNDKIDNFNIQFRMRHKQGHYLHILSRGFGVKNEHGQLIRMVGTHTDISENMRLSKQLEYQASHDALTALVNRSEFEKRLQRLITDNTQHGTVHAMCYLDLDNFKVINDTCGHLAGDAMLKQLSESLLTSIRSRDTLARLGGDEFGILMEHCSIEQAHAVAEKILSVVQDFRFNWEVYKFTVGVSIGLVPVNESSGSVNQIMAAADSACYLAKDAGRNCIHTSTPDDDELEKRKGEMQWVARINEALEEDRFCLFYQELVPTGTANDKKLNKRFEMLVRIKDHDGSYIMPGAFLPAAERYDLSTRIDHWVVDATIRWLSTHEHILDSIDSCAINVSGLSLGNQSFLEFCLKTIHEHRIPANKICFEITETAAIANLSSAIHYIEQLKEAGCSFSLDDFGSGLSSFGYLKNLPVDYVKIDGCFVRDIEHDQLDFEMVQTINRIGHIMGKETIAEFVENDVIASLLENIGVNYLQGYGIAVPKPISEYPAN